MQELPSPISQKPIPIDVAYLQSLVMVGHPSAIFMKDLADTLEVDLVWLVNLANDHENGNGDDYYLHPEDSGRFEGEFFPDEFWHHWAELRNISVDAIAQPEVYFSCAC